MGSINSNKYIEVEKYVKTLLQEDYLVGDLYSINYEFAKVIIHDHYRQKVGGIPSLSFLLASRLDPNNCSSVDFKKEDTSFILLRVMDSAALPQDVEAERIRVETAQRVVGETNKNYDSPDAMDIKTRNLFNYAGVQCKIIGTFFFEEDESNSEAPLRLRFGCDISNYYPNRGLKVYKPVDEALKIIVNYTEAHSAGEGGETGRVKIGHVRYASTNRKYQSIDSVPVYIYPADLLSQKTALFGMTRTGKSNTTKIIAKSVFELRRNKDKDGKDIRIGQVIFDPNGEYANDNEQDNNSALKNVWKLLPNARKEDEVATYGITEHPKDPDRELMKVNFFLDDNLQIGKEIINSLLLTDTSDYVKSFCQVIFEKPDENDYSAITRYKRKVLTYRSLLVDAGFAPPKNMMPYIKGLFSEDLQKAMANNDSASEYKADYQSAA